MRGYNILLFLFSIALASGLLVIINPYPYHFKQLEAKLPIDLRENISYNPIGGVGFYGDIFWGFVHFLNWVRASLELLPTLLADLGVPKVLGVVIEMIILMSLGTYLFHLMTGRRTTD